jgi:uncharacterized protein YegP (UPF0339 family)
MDEGIELLTGLFFEKDWFVEAYLDKNNRYVVYVKYMNMETMTTIPDILNGKQVVSHFISSKLITTSNKSVIAAPILDTIEELSSDLLEIDLDDLLNEFAALENICNLHTIEDLFFEIHDRKNAVTNLSGRYPDIAARLQKLYDDYGFDVIYDQLDG